MIEIPEASNMSRQVRESLAGKQVESVQAAGSPHKFAWYEGDPAGYPALLSGQTIQTSRPVGGMLEIVLDDTCIVFSEGAYPRLFAPDAKLPTKHQLLLTFTDGVRLAVTVRMYGGILVFKVGMGANDYYLLADQKPSPLTPAFDQGYFMALIGAEEVQKLSAKAFLATDQRIPGLGNGVLQDILYQAGIHPKMKINALTGDMRLILFSAIEHTLSMMGDEGGRDTEKDLFGKPGGYQTKCSKLTVGKPCLKCENLIQKGSYMGGSIYFCPSCQPI